MIFLLKAMIFSTIMLSLATWKIYRDINIKVTDTYGNNFYVEVLKMLNPTNGLKYISFSRLIQINRATDVYEIKTKKIPEYV